ncbi:MAG: spore coat protein [Clostridia bacterium]|nr:spore coat protein [Clostridia bacterium]
MSLTEKELENVGLSLAKEQVLVRKYRTFSSLCSDAELKKKLGEIADKHQQHFNTLMGFLQ